MGDNGLVFSLELLVSKDNGVQVPLIIYLGRPCLGEQGNSKRVSLRYLLDGSVHRERWAGGGNALQAVCLGISMLKAELEHFYFLKGYRVYRCMDGKEKYCEVGIEDLFPYATV